jgi:hypothetical protein
MRSAAPAGSPVHDSACRLTAEPQAGYLYIRIEGSLASGNVQRLAKKVVSEYERDPRPALLVDVTQLTITVDVLTTVRLVGMLPRLAKGLHAPAAIVYQQTNYAIVKFYETVAMNRGYLTRIFPAVEPAADWLGG